MSSADKQADVATQQADEVISAKEKGAGDAKTEKSPQKRTSAEVADDDDVKKKVQKTDHKGDKKENGESDEKYEEGAGDEEAGDDEDDDAVPDGEDYDEEGDDPEGDDDPEDDDEDDA
ncbi:uncharacterized protein LOC144104636 [Amblyomma americanum]|uniref:Putative ribosomal l1 domain-containing protein n=2 Tax=Amblyomma TaxID=6942 RepID=A0A0C9SBZ2_AMBAM